MAVVMRVQGAVLVLASGQVNKCILIIHLVRYGRSRVWVWNIMTSVIITVIDNITGRMDHVRFVCRIVLIGVLRLPDNFVMSWELHLFNFRNESKNLFLRLCGFAAAVWSNTKVFLNLRSDDWECGLFFRLSVSSMVVVME